MTGMYKDLNCTQRGDGEARVCDGGRGELKPAAWPRSGVQGAEGFLMLFHLILFDASGPLFTRFCFVFCFWLPQHEAS